MSALSFEIEKQDKESRARVGLIRTRRGDIETPYLVPVATLGSVRALGSDDLAALGVVCTLANTYHLHLKPGDELIARLGGLHRFMGFAGPLFTDSGGFQAFSMGFAREHNIGKIGSIFPGEAACEEDCSERSTKRPKKENLTRITDEGISFKSQADGAWHFLDAEKSMRIQSNLGSEIIMAFDECTSPLSGYDYTRRAMLRSHNWAEQSLLHHDRSQAIYGIIQGGWFEELRRESTRAIADMPFDGIAIGGSLGNSKLDMHQVLDWAVSGLDEGRPRHLLGIGEIDDLFECVGRGIDTFDCVFPTRIARRGSLLISPGSGGSLKNKFRINIKSSRFKEDGLPPDPGCSCPTCRTYSRAYLRHLYEARELSYFRLATVHNLHFMLRLMEHIRESIRQGSFSELKGRWLKGI
ncbi:MAG TPA: tRNA guanosine(34) transglycosylase Tgt [Methanothrix sp.]|jgi:tRNA-guanine transglycosylase|nr:tRNA guanosine(34) transglycosylase Tgt [Methanothrix sp.]